jgi:hypothetical protein
MIILSVSARELRLTVCAYADILKGAGRITAKLFFFPVFNKRFDFSLKNIFFKTKKTVSPAKKKKKRVLPPAKNIFTVIQNVRITGASADISAGIKDDAFLTAMASGTAKILLYAARGVISGKFGTEVKCNIKPSFNENVFKLYICVKAYISLADLIFGFIASLIKKRKAEKAEAGNGGKKKENKKL